MGDGAAQAEKMSGESPQTPGSEPESQELQVPSPSVEPSPPATPGPSPTPGATDIIQDGKHVNAITVLTLLDKLVNMLDKVQDNQQRMEKRQIELEGSVKCIQGDLSKLTKNHSSTSNTVSKLLEKSRKVSVSMRDVRDRIDKQCSQVKKLENNHSLLLRRNNFKVLIFQDENEIPTNVLMREPTSMASLTEGQEEPNNEDKGLKKTLHTIELSSDDEIQADNDGLDDSIEEKCDESITDTLKSLSLRKVDSLKKAFSKQSLEKHMNKIGTKIVSPERREKIMKSFTQSHHIASAKFPSLKLTPLTFNVKKASKGKKAGKGKVKHEDEEDAEQTKENEKISVTQLLSEMASSGTGEIKAIVDSLVGSEMNRNPELSVTEDNEEFGEAQAPSNSKQSESEPKRDTEDEHDLREESIPQKAVHTVDQTA